MKKCLDRILNPRFNFCLALYQQRDFQSNTKIEATDQRPMELFSGIFDIRNSERPPPLSAKVTAQMLNRPPRPHLPELLCNFWKLHSLRDNQAI